MAAADPSAAAAAEEEEEGGGGGGRRPRGASEYEEQRLARIKENRARLEALGLPALSSSLLRAPSKRRRHGEEHEENESQSDAKKKKRADGEEDEEYQPSDDGDEEEVDGDGSSSGEQDEEEEDYKPPSSSRRTPKIKGKKKDSLNGAKVRRSLYLKAKMKERDTTDDDIALKQAIALSLGGDTEDSAPVSVGIFRDSGANIADEGGNIKINRGNIQDTYAKKKRKGNVSRVQLTEDEVVAYFFTFDEVGKGEITLRDLRRMAAAHDFCWTDIEMATMIHCFDSNRDGKLSLDDFQNIVTRCNMMQKS